MTCPELLQALGWGHGNLDLLAEHGATLSRVALDLQVSARRYGRLVRGRLAGGLGLGSLR